MRKTFRLLFVALFVGGWALSAAALHVVKAPGRLIVVPKNQLSFSDIYVDTSNWSEADVQAHPALVTRLIERGKADALQSVAPNATGDQLLAKLNDAIHNAAPTTQNSAVTIKLER